MKIIDASLQCLDEYEFTQEQLFEWINLFGNIGIHDFIISKKIYQQIPFSQVTGNEYYMFLEDEKEKVNYKEVKNFVLHKQIKCDFITRIQINDSREILQLRNYAAAKMVMLCGMEDFLCYDYKSILQKILSTLRGKQIIFCPDNDKDCAVALATMFIHFGGAEVVGTFAGISNHAPTEQLIISLRLTQRFKINQKLTDIVKIRDLYETVTGTKIPGKMPVIGSKIFQVESGIHIDGILKNQSNYETFPPEMVGQKREIIVGKHSGTNSIRYKAQELNLSCREEQLKHVLHEVKTKSVFLRRSLTEDEFAEIIRQGR